MSGIREIPTNIDPNLRDYLQDLQVALKKVQGSQTPLAVPTNFKVTAQAFQNLLQWTRVVNADYYEVLWNSTPNVQTAKVQGVGDSAAWVDNVGQANVARTYWVRACRYTGAKSPLSPGLTKTTLAAGTGVTPPSSPPASHILVVDSATGHIIPYIQAPKRGESR
jgi:hypothetical protein